MKLYVGDLQSSIILISSVFCEEFSPLFLFCLFSLGVSDYPVILEHELQKLISGDYLILFNSGIVSLNYIKIVVAWDVALCSLVYYSSVLKMEATHSSETSVMINQTAQCHIQGGSDICSHCCDDLTSPALLDVSCGFIRHQHRVWICKQ
jgi:hypothetical protein